MFILGVTAGILAVVFELLIIAFLPKILAAAFIHPEKVKNLEIDSAVGLVVLTILMAGVEEIVKAAVLRWNAYDNSQFNQVADGAVLGISVALGFATLENIGYFLQAFLVGGVETLAVIFAARFLATTLLHALATGTTGYFLGKEKFSGNKRVFWYGLLAAILIHAVYNLFLLTVAGFFLVIVFLIVLFIFLVRRMESTEARTIWRLVWIKKV